MIVLNICRPLRHSPGGSLFALLAGCTAAGTLTNTEVKCRSVCVHASMWVCAAQALIVARGTSIIKEYIMLMTAELASLLNVKIFFTDC